ncbi:MAG: hypothetical protein WCT45_02560 [Candidatus Paceibacterota bacterium]|jgi:hypothetical protein
MDLLTSLSNLSYDRILLLVSGFLVGAVVSYRLLFGGTKKPVVARNSDDFWTALKRNADRQ